MTEIIKTITVDLARQGNTRLIFARQNDSKSRRLRIQLTDNGTVYPVPDGAAVTVSFLRPDGQSEAFMADVAENGCVEITLSCWALAVSGSVRCAVSLFADGDKKLTSSDFYLDVIDELYAGDDVSEDASYSLLTGLLAKVAEAETAELAREKAETARVEAEAERIEAEADRVTKDASRSNAESARMTIESKRVSAERQRVDAENARVSAETSRASAEAARDSAESQRRSAEQSRRNEELSRSTAESRRAFAEQTREGAERAREEAERAREEAELIRESEREFVRQAAGVSLTDTGEHYESENLEGAMEEVALRLDEAEKELAARSPSAGKTYLYRLNWGEDRRYALEIADLKDKDMISFTPASEEDRKLMDKHEIFIEPEVTDTRVELRAKSLPETDIALYYFITRWGST